MLKTLYGKAIAWMALPRGIKFHRQVKGLPMIPPGFRRYGVGAMVCKNSAYIQVG